MKVLVVDDNPDNIELVCQVLEDYHETITAANGQQCLEIAVHEQPDLILLDVMMPVMGGFETLEHLIENKLTRDIPVIFLTARYKDIDRVVKGLSLGAFDYITKPFEDELLLARVNVALRIKKAEDEIRAQALELKTQNDTLASFKASIVNLTENIAAYGVTGNVDVLQTDSLEPDVQVMADTFKNIVKDRNRVGSELGIREKELHQIIDNMVNGVIAIDEKGTIQSFNRAATRMFGYVAEEVIGNKVNVLMPDYHGVNHDSYLTNYLAGGQPKIIGQGREVMARHKDGHFIPIHISVAELPLDADGNRRFIGSCLDMTLQKNQERQIRRTQKMEAMGNLTGGIAHDYNNMLGVISGFSELLEMELSDSPQLKEFAVQINHAASRGVQLTKKLLGISKHKLSENEVHNINALLEDMRYVLEKTLTVRVKLELELQADLWNVYLDVGDLEDCLLNLSINAMHAMPDGGKLSIGTYKENLSPKEAEGLGLEAGEYICLTVQDDGIGMDEDTLNRIFDPFFTSKGANGTGLGLSQVYGFVQRSQGSIIVESLLGQGTTFNIYFPRCETDVVESIDELDFDSSDYAGSGTILVVDDEPAYRSLLNTMLTSHGYTVKIAETSDEALALVGRHDIDLMLSDVIMKDVDGYRLAEMVRELKPDMKIQLFSGYNRKIADTDFGASLQQRLLKKPVPSNVLLSRLKEMLVD